VDDGPRFDPAWTKLPAPGSQRQAVLLYFAANGPGTREQAKTALGITSEGTTRVFELIQGGFLHETGEERLSANGKLAAVVDLTDHARRELRLVPTRWYPGGKRV
jgi:hypothetical protein